MLRLQSTLTQASAVAGHLFSGKRKTETRHTVVQNYGRVTADCVPKRRRRARRQLATGSGEVLRSTWF